MTATEKVINELKKYTSGKKNTEKIEISVLVLNRVISALEQKPCEDCVSRQAVLNLINADWEYEGLESDVKNLPPVVPQPKIGHWIEENINEWSRKIFCSECGCPPPFEHVSNGDVYSTSGYGVSNKTKFCPNCNARMIEPQVKSEDEE